MKENTITISTREKYVINVDKRVFRKFLKKAYKHSANSIPLRKRMVDYYTEGAVSIATEEDTSLEDVMKKAIKDFDKFTSKLSKLISRNLNGNNLRIN